MMLYKDFDIEELQAIYDSMVTQYCEDRKMIRNHPNHVATATMARRSEDILLPLIMQFRKIDGIIH